VQRLGSKEVDEGIWLFIDYDPGYIDLQHRILQTLDNPVGPRQSPMAYFLHRLVRRRKVAR
jgi:hypothetical protein